MGALVPGLKEERGNIQQRVFDAFPEYPGIVSVDSLVAALPFDRLYIRKALFRLSCIGKIELRGACCIYRRVKNASTPVDMRGHHGNSGRRPKLSA